MEVQEQDTLNDHLEKTFKDEQQRFYHDHPDVEETDDEEEPPLTSKQPSKKNIKVSQDKSATTDKQPPMDDAKRKQIFKAINESLTNVAPAALKKKCTIFASTPTLPPKRKLPIVTPNTISATTTTLDLSKDNSLGSIQQLLNPPI